MNILPTCWIKKAIKELDYNVCSTMFTKHCYHFNIELDFGVRLGNNLTFLGKPLKAAKRQNQMTSGRLLEFTLEDCSLYIRVTCGRRWAHTAAAIHQMPTDGISQRTASGKRLFWTDANLFINTIKSFDQNWEANSLKHLKSINSLLSRSG